MPSANELLKLLGSPSPLVQNVAFVAIVFVGLGLVLAYMSKRDNAIRNEIENDVVKPLTDRLNDLESRIENGCVHLLKAIGLAAKHNDVALDHELQLAATALSKRKGSGDGA